MHIFVLIEEEYDDNEWEIKTVLNNKEEALKCAWLAAMDDWHAYYHVQHWDLNGTCVARYYCDSKKLKNEQTPMFIHALETQLQTDDAFPDALNNYMRVDSDSICAPDFRRLKVY